VLGVTIALARRLPVAIRAQIAHRWAQDELEGASVDVRTLQGQRMGIVGLGAIGLELVNSIWRKLQTDENSRAWSALSPASEDVRMHLLATGRYLTMLGGLLLHYNSERWSLKRLPIDLGTPHMPIAVFTLKNRTLSPVARAFIEQARSLMRSIKVGE